MIAKELPEPLDDVVARIRALSSRDAVSGCLVWPGAKIGHGYGQIRVNGTMYLTHRVMLAAAQGDRPDLLADHICHNPSCGEPAHLRWATSSENASNRSGANRGNPSGILGVTRASRSAGWRARVMVHGISHDAYFSDSMAGGTTAARDAAQRWAEAARAERAALAVAS